MGRHTAIPARSMGRHAAMGTVLRNQKGHVFVGWWSLRENEGDTAAGLLSPEVTAWTADWQTPSTHCWS